MTGQDILDYMEVMDQELQLQPSEEDVVNALRALNIAQDMFELVAAQYKRFLGGQTTTVTTAASTETTAFPTGWLRIDRLQFIDPDTSLPLYDLEDAEEVGGHVYQGSWPVYLTRVITTGRPSFYWTNGRNIYWSPLPDDTHTVRVYGFAQATNITAAGTFAYPDQVAPGIASYAVRVMRSGKDDPADMDLAKETFDPVIATLRSFNKSGFGRPSYRHYHDC